MGVFASKEKNLDSPDSSRDQQTATQTSDQTENPATTANDLPDVPTYIPTSPAMEDEPLALDDIPIIPLEIPEKIESPPETDKSVVPSPRFSIQ